MNQLIQIFSRPKKFFMFLLWLPLQYLDERKQDFKATVMNLHQEIKSSHDGEISHKKLSWFGYSIEAVQSMTVLQMEDKWKSC